MKGSASDPRVPRKQRFPVPEGRASGAQGIRRARNSLCGVPSAKKVLVFIALIAALSSASAAHAQSGGDPEAGRDVFDANCAMCHGSDAGGMMGMHPSLRGSVERLTLEGVEVTIRNGRDTNPPMPPFEGELTDEEIADVISYLDTLPVGPRNFGAGHDGMMGGDMDGMMDDMMGGGMWSWFAWSVLFLVVLAAVVVGSIFVVRRMWDRGPQGPGSSSRALDILKERYARGEIDRDEFEERREHLGL